MRDRAYPWWSVAEQRASKITVEDLGREITREDWLAAQRDADE